MVQGHCGYFDLRSEHINKLELQAIHLALKFFLLLLRHGHMLVPSDIMTVR